MLHALDLQILPPMVCRCALLCMCTCVCSPPSVCVAAAVSPSELWLEPVELHCKFWTAFYFEKTACASSPRRSFKRAGATGWSPAGSHGCHGCHGCQFVFVTWV